MPIRNSRFALAVLFCLSLAGCHGFFDSSSTIADSPQFAYVVNANGGGMGSIGAYKVDPVDGGLSAAGGQDVKVDAPIGIAAHPNGNFIYITNQKGEIAAFSIDRKTGALTETGTGVVTSEGQSALAVEITPDGKFLYALTSSPNEIEAFAINSTTGALSALNNIGLGGVPVRFEIPSYGRFVYVALGPDGTQIFQIKSDGSLSSLKTVPASPCKEVTAIAFDRKVRYAFLADKSGGICNYAVLANDGSLVRISETVNPGGSGPVSVALNPDSSIVATANNASNDVTTFAVALDGTVTPAHGSPLPVGQAPSDVAVDPSGRFMYVTNAMDDSITIFRINDDQTFKNCGTWTTGPNPKAIAVIP